jgi:hypothetical protein
MARLPSPALSALLLGLLALAGCGGTVDGIVASGDRPAGDPSFEPGTVRNASFSFVGFEGNGTLRAGIDESQVNLGTGAVTGGGFAGTLNDARTRITLDGGGNVILTNPAGTEYVRFFDTVSIGSDPVFGVVGFLSRPSDLPSSGRVSYTGATQVVAADALRLYDLDGTAYIVADFGNNTVRIELRDLAGSAQGSFGSGLGTVTLRDAGEIVVEGSRISGATFSGGVAFVSGTSPFTLSGRQDATGTNGGFFGRGADETAGRVVVDDPRSDTLILGRFAAD